MISYYKLNQSYFKLDEEKTFFQHVSNTFQDKSIIYGSQQGMIETLHNAKTNWTVITEEEYNTVKSDVIAFLSAN